jgi:4-hydroxybenzoate polyprenyltransferase
VEIIWKIALGVLAFSLLASAVYILNDYIDRESDRAHPTKRNRPLASGKADPQKALLLMGVLIMAGLGIFAWLSLPAMYLALAYLVLNVLYTFRLKHIPIIYIFIISLGFVIRIAVGSAVGDIPLSMWLILMTYLLALFLALAKRRDDVLLAEDGTKVRKAIDGYNLEFINGAMMIMASVLIVAYISYTISPDGGRKYGSDYLYITVFFVLLGILRYMQITFVEQKSGSPTQVLLKDHFLQLTLLGWLITFVLLIY